MITQDYLSNVLMSETRAQVEEEGFVQVTSISSALDLPLTFVKSEIYRKTESG